MKEQKPTVKKKDTCEKKIINLNDEIESLKKQIKAKEDQFLRTLADYQNYQKRTEKEKQLNTEETKKKYIQELINLQELLKIAANDKNPKDGLQLIINNIDNFFVKEQIKYIDCIGQKFDHSLHHAITTIERDDCEENTILEEVKKGYIYNNKVLRPAHVVVSKKKKIV